MGKSIFILIVITITVFGLLFTGCDRALQITSPTIEEPEMIELEISELESPAIPNTGDCISQVGPVTSQGGQRALQECLERNPDTEGPENPE